MKGSDKKVSFSSPTIKSSSPKVGSDENGRSNQQKRSFMSPTISAASKVNFPRKKILGERNESPLSNSFITHFSKSVNLNSNPSPKMNQKVVPQKSSSPNLERTPLSYNSKDGTPSTSAYDPLKNYLSPRPQFLRYNPDRRNEIFLRLEMEDEADTVCSQNSSLDSSSSLDSGDESESLLEEEDEESDTEREEDVEEEEVTWSFRGMMKYLLLCVVLALSTSYISSMNAPVAAPAFEGAFSALGFQNLSVGIVEDFDVGYKFLDLKQEQLGLLSFNEAIGDEVVEEELTENASLEIDEDKFEEDFEGFVDNIELQEIEDVIEENGKTQNLIEYELAGNDIDEQLGQETVEEIEFLQVDNQARGLSEGTDSSEEISMVASKEIQKETRDDDMVQVQIMLEKWGKSIALKFQELNLQGFNQDMGACVAIVVFALVTCASIVVSFAFGSKIRRNGNEPKQSPAADEKHSTKSVVNEKSPSFPLAAERDEPKELVISTTTPLITTSAVPVGSRAPSVELLAEFDVGGISRQVKSASGTKYSRMQDDEVSSSSHSYFSEQGFSQLSAERSIAKKKQLESNDLTGEGRNNEVMTPLRRSTRIRISYLHEGCDKTFWELSERNSFSVVSGRIVMF